MQPDQWTVVDHQPLIADSRVQECRRSGPPWNLSLQVVSCLLSPSHPGAPCSPPQLWLHPAAGEKNHRFIASTRNEKCNWRVHWCSGTGDDDDDCLIGSWLRYIELHFLPAWVKSTTWCTPPLKKAIPRSLGSTISQKPCSKRTPTDSEYDIG